MKRIFLLLVLFTLPSFTFFEVGMPPKIIDAHVHIDFEDGDLSNYKAFIDNHYAAVIAHAPLSHPIPQKKASLPFKVIACGAVSPGEVTVAEMEQAFLDKKIQCLKVYLGYVSKYPNDPFYLPFYQMAEKRNIPVVFHTGDTSDKDAHVKYADPLGVDEIAVEYPKMKILLAHLGNPWFQSVAEVLYKNDNVYADLSAFLLGDISKHPPEAVEELVVKPVKWVYLYVNNPKKFLFGTDWNLTDPASYIEMMKKAIPQKDWNGFFYQNAVEFFGIDA